MMYVPFMIARGWVSYVSELRMYVSFINWGVIECWCIGERSSCGSWVAVENVFCVSCPSIIGWCMLGVCLAECGLAVCGVCVTGLRVFSMC